MHFKKKACVALLGATLGLSITNLHAFAATPTCEPGQLATKYPSLAHATVKVGQDGESPPFSYRDPNNFNHLVGLDADLARAVFGCVGVPITFSTGSWSGLLPATIAGQLDVMWDTLLYTSERAKKLDFVTYMGAATGFLVAKGNPKHLKSLDDLCGVRATAGLGTTQDAQLRETSAKCTAAGKAPVEIINSPDIPSGMRMVQNGRADVFSTNKALIGSVMEKTPGVYEMAFDIRTNARIAVGMAKNRDELRRAVFDGLSAISADGRMKTIFDENHVSEDLIQPIEVLTK